MPFIQVRLIEKVLTNAQKAEAIAKLKDAIVSIQAQLERPVSLIVVEEKSNDVRSEVWDCLSQMSPELSR
jgi:phenylpyruvate tautomerase PptA (4-oxalocrotonate tautomerase family)